MKVWIVALIVLVLIVGCGRKVQQPADEVIQPPVQTPPAEEVPLDLTELDTIDQDLESNGLEDLEQELEDLDW